MMNSLDIHWHKRLGLGACGAFFVILLGGLFVTLDGAVVASGVVQVDLANKSVQHRDGGIVKRIHVREGGKVREGDLVITLENDELAAEVTVLDQHETALLAERLRLEAERDNVLVLSFPEQLVERAVTESPVQLLLVAQQRQFQARSQWVENQKKIEQARISQLRQQISGSRQQLANVQQQTKLLDADLQVMRELADIGLKPAIKVREVERLLVESKRREAEITSDMARTEQAIVETEAKILQIEKSRQTEIAEELRRNSEQLNQVTPQLAAKRMVLKRTEIRAPATGVIFDQRVFTEGGVIRAGEKLFDIVPDRAELIVETRVSPFEVDQITVGAPAQVKFASPSQRREPNVEGRVQMVTPDHLIDQRSGTSFFRVLVSVVPADRRHSLMFTPGLPVEVYFPIKPRTVLSYLLDPLTANLNRALREPH